MCLGSCYYFRENIERGLLARLVYAGNEEFFWEERIKVTIQCSTLHPCPHPPKIIKNPNIRSNKHPISFISSTKSLALNKIILHPF